VQTTFNANNNNFSAAARALTNDTGLKVSAGFVASRIKRMEAKEIQPLPETTIFSTI